MTQGHEGQNSLLRGLFSHAVCNQRKRSVHPCPNDLCVVGQCVIYRKLEAYAT